MVVMPVIPTAIISDGHIPMRTKMSPVMNPRMAKITTSTRRTVTNNATKATIRGIRMILNPQKKRLEFGSFEKPLQILSKLANIHRPVCPSTFSQP